MKIVINRTVVAYSIVVGMLIGMAMQQGVLARRAYGSYDLDEDSRRAILQGRSSSSSQTRTRERRTRTRVRQPNRAQRQAPVVVPVDDGASSGSSSESSSTSNSSTTSTGSGSAPSSSAISVPSSAVKPGGLSPLSKIDPPTTYSK